MPVPLRRRLPPASRARQPCRARWERSRGTAPTHGRSPSPRPQSLFHRPGRRPDRKATSAGHVSWGKAGLIAVNGFLLRTSSGHPERGDAATQPHAPGVPVGGGSHCLTALVSVAAVVLLFPGWAPMSLARRTPLGGQGDGAAAHTRRHVSVG